MIPDAARIRKWILCSLPAVALAGTAWYAGGPLAMAVWMAFGGKRLKRKKLYPKERRPGPGPLFLAFSAGAFCINCLNALLIQWVGRSSAFSLPGQIISSSISLTFCQFFLSHSPKTRAGKNLNLWLSMVLAVFSLILQIFIAR